MMRRREFVAAMGIAGSMVYTGYRNLYAQETMKLKVGDVLLFQGDSITDAGREKQNPVANAGLGRGYPNFIADQLRKKYSELDLQVHNRGISGNKVPDLASRWDKDCIAIKPRVLSILIGVNDIWHKLNGRYDGTAETYRDGFAALLSRTREALPETTIVICEPFVLESGTVKENKDKWFPEFEVRRGYAKEVAEGAGAVWVPFQTMFDEAVAAGSTPEMFAGDGVHPTAQGHQLMAKTWIEKVGL